MLKSFRSRINQSIDSISQKITQSAIARWNPYSRLLISSDSASWVLDWEKRELSQIAQKLGIRFLTPELLIYAKNQSIFYYSQFILLETSYLEQSHHIGFSYFHGHPETPEEPKFSECYQRLCQHHERVQRIQVSHSEMKNIILDSGIAPEKVFLIPIGINLSFFSPQTLESRQKIRQKYNIPSSAVVVGSCQKDGVGWEEGLEPKLIKGPDIFLKTIELLKLKIPELFVLLSGPARGYVKTGLERLKVPYYHRYLSHYPEVGELFQALDLYIIASRQEGGPKAVLESMASGIPLITTRVGQAMDLVEHGKNGWMVDVEDAEGLAHWAEYALTHKSDRDRIIQAGLQTAKANSYDAQIPLWREFMQGFVEF
ncbi:MULTISPECIES: glycosyltransferase family 4 protein [Spirulina sp. CCY15215]|uniref:glycosyltransferase family 4 protein n=1 Tax=Spirulina sp. CCY15215 TaxID=2767591 RepID=UPI0019505DD3